MSAFSNKTEAAIVNHFLRGVAQPASSTLYLALFTADPGDENIVNEATYEGYVRRVITFSAIDVNGDTSNELDIYFPANTGASQTIAAAAVVDQLTGGFLVLHGVTSVSKVLETNDLLSFAAGGFTVNVD